MEMDARLYEAVRGYLLSTFGDLAAVDHPFRFSALRVFVLARPSMYPEFSADEGRLLRSLDQSVVAEELIQLNSVGRDPNFRLRSALDGPFRPLPPA
jgi:hypothetical protein